MSSFLKDGVLMDVSGQVPAPNKDFVNMKVTTDKISWSYWKINPQCLHADVTVAPSEMHSSLSDFLHDTDFQSEVKRVYGKNTLIYLKNLCKGHFNFLDRLEKPLQVYLISFLELEDIASLAQVSKHFKEVCYSDQLWEHLVERFCDTVTPDMRLYAQEVGWKQVFFTNKLQLQMQMRRRKQKSVEFGESQ